MENMFSYKTKLAVKIILLLSKSPNKESGIIGFREALGFEHTVGIRNVVKLLHKAGWISIKRDATIKLVANINLFTLYDIVLLTDKEITLDTHVELECSALDNEHQMIAFRNIDEQLNSKMREILSQYSLGGLLN